MQKDYVPVDTSVREIDEAAFVEQYWTAQWRDRGRPVDVSRVGQREEYRIMRPFLDRLAGGSRILDGGCGTGEWTAFLSERGFKVVGVDISEQTVQRLREWFPHLEFLRADLRHTAFESASFDAYFSWGTFEHFESGLGGCLAEARRLIKPGGWLFVSVPFHNWRLILRDSLGRERQDERPQRFYQWRLTRPELRRELELHGFEVHTIEPIAKQTGAGRMLQWDLPLFAKGSRLYNAATRALAGTLPGSYLAHMIMAVARRR